MLFLLLGIYTDTLFSRVVWERKVSHILIENAKGSYKVVLLMVPSWPYSFRSHNYALYYQFSSYKEAWEKFHWLNAFLKCYGVLRVYLQGSRIVGEEILFSGYFPPPGEIEGCSREKK